MRATTAGPCRPTRAPQHPADGEIHRAAPGRLNGFWRDQQRAPSFAGAKATGIDDAAFWGNLPRQHRVLVGIGCRRPAKTPAVVDPNLTKERLCDPGFRTSTVRHVS